MPHDPDPTARPAAKPAPDQRSASERGVTVETTTYRGGHAGSWHRHESACLIYPSEGAASVETEKGHWVVPPQRAVWVPAGVGHRTSMSGRTTVSSLIVDREAASGLPEASCAIGISPLLRELIVHACTAPSRPGTGEPGPVGPDARILAVILDQIRSLPAPALPLPLPRDRRLRRVVEALLEDPADNRSLEDWGRLVGASSRTLARLFRSETSMTFRAWRRHLRVLEALRRLAEGESVTNVALDVGYESPSAFVQMFRRCVGRTPGRYFG